MDCPSCGGAVPEGGRFCVQCGAALPAICAACGFANPGGARFCAGCGVELKSAASAADGVRQPPSPTPAAERRQLSVLFCDLVGSTELSARLDPEEMREVIRGYQNAVAAEVERFEGHVAKFMGDGVLAYFGYPTAHEDDAERAVRAGLAITGKIGCLSADGRPLSTRIGIATGLVVVGDLIGEGVAREQAVVGETPNLAARLQAVAEPGSVVIAASTRRLLGELFELRDRGQYELKGFAKPVAAFAVSAEWTMESRFEARSGPSLLPMVGRDQELALLLERWAQAKAGEGQGVLLVGEAGIGKSRISRALLDAVAEEPHVRIRYQCSPYHSDSALWPVIQQISRAADFAAADPLETRLDKLEALLGRADGSKLGDVAPLIAELLGLDGAAARYGKLDLAPQVQRSRTFEALVEQMLGLAAKQPVLVVLEDAHWIDPTTLELIEQCLDRIAAARVMILLTSRPDNQPRLAAHPHVTRLTLNRLGRAGVEAIVARLGGDQLPTETIAAIIARTDGVPLFVEELTKAVLETGETAIPASLHDSLMARLDRAPEVKEIAQIAACIGREFDYGLLAAVADRPGRALGVALDRLTAAELVFRRGTPPEARYTFKHALVRDAAYHNLLKARRQQLHARLLAELEHAGAAAEMLAHHATEAAMTEPAIRYWRQAGEHSLRAYANLEAIKQLRQAIELNRLRPAGIERDRAELALLLSLAPATRAIKGYATQETLEVYTRAHELISETGSIPEQMNVIYGLWGVHYVRAEHAAAMRWAEQAWTLATAGNEPEARTWASRMVGECLWSMGKLTEGLAWLERCLGDASDRSDITDLRYSPDHYVTALVFLGWTLFPLGHLDRAARAAADALTRAAKLGHPMTIILALMGASCLAMLRRDVEETTKLARRGIALCLEHGAPTFGYWISFNQGWACFRQGDVAAGIATMRQALVDMGNTHTIYFRPMLLGHLAEACAECGKGFEGLELLDEAIDVAERTGERVFEAEVHRLRGDQLIRAAQFTEAEVAWQRALAVAGEQAAKTWELRAALSLARLWAEQGRRREAHDLLAPIYGWFAEGFDTADLKEAKALLDQLE